MAIADRKIDKNDMAVNEIISFFRGPMIGKFLLGWLLVAPRGWPIYPSP
jgi:hypothetical protein